MFSAGNITEKLRIASFDCRGEDVVDLYAGMINFNSMVITVFKNCDQCYDIAVIYLIVYSFSAPWSHWFGWLEGSQPANGCPQSFSLWDVVWPGITPKEPAVTVEKISAVFVICPLLLWCCWLGGRKGIACKKLEWWGTGMVICLERDADLHMAQPMPLPFTVSCFSKVQIGFTFLVPAHLGSPGKRPLNGCVCLWFVPSVCTSFQTVIPEYKLLQPWLQFLSVLVLPHYLVPTNMHRFNSHFSSEPTVVSLPAGFQNTYLLFYISENTFLTFFNWHVKKSLADVYSSILWNEFTTSLWCYS